MKLYILFLFFCVGIFADDANVTWTITCTGNTGFGFTWSAISGDEAFKPDGKLPPTVPCDEYFEVSFSVIDSVSGHPINFNGVTGDLYSVAQKYSQNGINVITIPPEISSFGAGFISSTGAMDTVTNTPFNLVCSNNQGNIKIQTNYMLTATNNNYPSPQNYLRTLDTIVDGGNAGTQNKVTPVGNPPTSFQVGQSMCVNGVIPSGFSFPSSAGGVAPPSSVVNSNGTAVVGTGTGNGNKLSSGAVAAIIIVIIVVVIASLIIGFVIFRKRYHRTVVPEGVRSKFHDVRLKFSFRRRR